MGKFMRKCKGIGEVAVMEVSHSHVGVKTRAGSLAVAQQAKRRKSSSPENSISELNSPRITSSAATCSDQTPASRDGSSEIVNQSLRSVTDLEDTHEEFDNSPYRDSMRELHSESTDLESTARRPEAKTPAKPPSVQELEDFFAELEKDETKKFQEKYNFDFVNDTPLEGRFEWIPLKQ